MQVAGKGRQASSLYHPVQLLYPLEVSQPFCRAPDSDNSEPPAVPLGQTYSDEDAGPDNPNETELPPCHLKRAAAMEAKGRMMAQALEKN